MIVTSSDVIAGKQVMKTVGLVMVCLCRRLSVTSQPENSFFKKHVYSCPRIQLRSGYFGRRWQ